MDDCIIIGGGPAGLTAAIYLARYHLKVRLFDDGSSRAAMIPCTRNHAGFPEGISGTDLLARMLAQAEKYGARREINRIETIEPTGDGFVVRTLGSQFETRRVLLATGVVNNRPAGLEPALHDKALACGLLRYCPVCDGYEVTDRRVAVIGTGEHGTEEALFLRGFARDLTLVAPDGEHTLDEACRVKLSAAGVVCVPGPCANFAIADEQLAFDTGRGNMSFASVYPALGSEIRSHLAIAAGADASKDGELRVDEHQRTSVPGLFAAGDVVKGLDQISHAMGQAGVAATMIRNELAKDGRLWR